MYFTIISLLPILITVSVHSLESENNISADFPYESKYINILGYNMHYIDEGISDGIPILFMHGNPTSVYLWRNVMPYLQNKSRIIAFDLIGMGQSDKLSGDDEYEYNFVTHYEFVKTFIRKLKLKNIILVLHDWGSGLGFYYAYQHQNNVRGIAFMEAMSPPLFPIIDSADAHLFINLLRTDQGEELVINQNAMFDVFLQQGIVRNLTEQEMNVYREPYLSSDDRYVLLQFPRQIPIEGEPEDVWEMFSNFAEWFVISCIPKLQIYVSPGIITTLESVEFNQDTLINYESLYVGHGLHFIQEDHPQKIGRGIADWFRRNFQK